MAEGTPWDLAQELGFLRRKVKALEKGREALFWSHSTRREHLEHLQTCAVCLNPNTQHLCKKGDGLAEEASLTFDAAEEALQAEARRPRAPVLEFTRQLDLLKVKPMEKPNEHSPASN